MKLLYPKNYTPREQWSPSGLSLAASCEMAWFYRYVLGIKEDDLLSWEDVEHLKRPAKAAKDASAAEQAVAREAIKEYNRLTRRALGHAAHDILARYYDWHPPLALIDWHTRPGRVAVKGLDYLPDPSQGQFFVEQELSMQWGGLFVRGFADLVHFDGESWVLYDYKTTYNFDYISTPDQLQNDAAACFYALAVMVAEDLTELRCRWVYFLTDEEKEPDAQVVDFGITREHAIKVLEPYEQIALQTRELMRLADVKAPQPNPTSCDDYNGCVYHHTRGGPCKPPRATTSQLIAKERLTQKLMQERKAAQLAKKQTTPKVAGGATQTGGPSAARGKESPRQPSAPLGPSNQRTRDMGKFSQARAEANTAPKDEEESGGDEQEVQETAPQQEARSKGGRPKSTASKARASAGDSPELGIVVGDTVLAIPPGTPLYKRALAVVEALFAD